MGRFVNKLETVVELIGFLEQKEVEGYQWVVYDTDNSIGSSYDLTCFYEQMDAIDYATEYQQIFNWQEAVPIGSLLNNLKQLERDWVWKTCPTIYHLKQITK